MDGGLLNSSTIKRRRRLLGSVSSGRYFLNDSNLTQYPIPSYIPKYFPSKRPSNPSMAPTKVPTSVQPNNPTSEPTGKLFCVELEIESDYHIDDISWTITGESTNVNGDGLFCGKGNWTLIFENYTVTSFTNGYYLFSESVNICKPSLLENKTEIATLVISLNDSNNQSSVVNMMMH